MMLISPTLAPGCTPVRDSLNCAIGVVLVTTKSYFSAPISQTLENRSDGSTVCLLKLLTTALCEKLSLQTADPAAHSDGVSEGIDAVNVVVDVVVVVEVVVVVIVVDIAVVVELTEELTGQFIRSADSPAKRKLRPTTVP